MKVRILFSAAFVMLFVFSSCNSQKPTKWRGPTGEGLYSSMGLLSEWPENGPEILWSFEELGKGHSSAVISGDNLYTSGMIDSSGHIFKLDLNGNLLYNKIYGPEFVESFHQAVLEFFYQK